MNRNVNKSFFSWVIFICFLYTLPLYLKNLNWLGILTFANIFALFAMSWDISSGLTGYLSLGHTFFIGLGGYASAILTHHLKLPLYPSIVISSFAAMIVGTLIIIPALRVRGPYFLMLSLALPLFLISIVRVGYLTDITGGHMGLFPLPVFAPVPERYKVYYLTITITLVIAYILWRIRRSDIGYVLKAIHDDEELLANTGINTFMFKSFSFLLCTFIGGLGGALWVHNIGSVAPHSILDLHIIVEIIIAVMIGGEGTVIGPLLGSYFSIILLEALRPVAPGMWRLLIFTVIGGSLIAVKPTGIIIESLKKLEAAISNWKKLGG
jgi:branched-chain amino acid transport system permease protein